MDYFWRAPQLRRLGYLLEHVLPGSPVTRACVRELLPRKTSGRATLLDPGLPASGAVDPRWRVRVNVPTADLLGSASGSSRSGTDFGCTRVRLKSWSFPAQKSSAHQTRGFGQISQKGSHVKMRHADGRVAIVPTGFVRWYNQEHRHSGIRFVTPAERHDGLDVAILAQRVLVYEKARSERPDRWASATRNWAPIGDVYLNPQERRSTDQEFVS